MAASEKSFPPEVVDKLKTYVYRLIDPRNGETFYVGKGKGNRVFAHIEAKLGDDDPNNKLRRIRQIRLAGFEVAHVIHRHGMDDKTAYEVEAALMDAYPGLTNIAGGHGNTEYGVMHAEEIIRRYTAEPAEFHHRAMLISVNRSAAENSLYEATRFAWKVNVKRAERAEVILATLQGMIVGAFVASAWLPADAGYFPGREDIPGRLGFVGEEAPIELASLYVGKRVPDDYRKRGSANPVKYHVPVAVRSTFRRIGGLGRPTWKILRDRSARRGVAARSSPLRVARSLPWWGLTDGDGLLPERRPGWRSTGSLRLPGGWCRTTGR